MDFSFMVLRFFAGGLFVIYGAAKMPDLSALAETIASYGFTNDRVSRLVARLLPSIEAAAGTLLIVGVAERLLCAALAMLLFLFAGAGGINLARGREMDCGCLGVANKQQLTWWHVIWNVALGCSLLAASSSPAWLELPRATQVAAVLTAMVGLAGHLAIRPAVSLAMVERKANLGARV